MGDLSPLDFFRQESSHFDAVVRTEAMKKVTIICALIGEEKARNDLVPFLRSRIGDLDQVLTIMAVKVGDFLPFIGGPDYAPTLIPLLESLCNIEEVTVRTPAAAATSKILSQLNPDQHSMSIQAFYELFLRLSSEESGEVFYSRVSSCQIIPEMYRAMPSQRAAIRETFGKLLNDDLAMVRRSAGQNFVNLAKEAEPEVLSTDYLNMMKSMAADEHSTVKVIAMENMSKFAQQLKAANATIAAADLLPIIRASADDPSWRVRLALATNYGDLAECFPPADVAAEIFAGAISLVQDVEPDVRSLALQGIHKYVTVIGGAQFLMEFIPVVVQLIEDPVPSVRKLLADACVDIAMIVSPELVSQHLSEVLIKLMSDDDPLVRLRLLKKMDVISASIPTLCTRLTVHIRGMFKDSNWRVRKELAIVMPSLLKNMGVDYFSDNFLSEFVLLLKDGVDEVRLACANAVPRFVDSNTVNWVFEKIFPSVRAMAGDEYLVRLTMLSALHGLIILDIPERFQSETLALIIGSTNDKVPNIRLRAAQVLGAACERIGPDNSKTQVRPVLAELLSDKDKDVKYFAVQAIKLCA